MQKVWKVVGKEYRYGSNVTAHIYRNGFDSFKNCLKAFPILEPFCLQYTPNTVVKAVKGSLGIMCFTSKSSALDFAQQVGPDATVIRVMGLGKPMIPRSTVCGGFRLSNLVGFDLLNRPLGRYNQKDAIAFKAIRVLE